MDAIAVLAVVGLADAVWSAPVEPARAESSRELLRVEPGRVSFVMTADGRWKSFGPRGSRALVKDGGVFVLADVSDGGSTKLVDSASGGTRTVAVGNVPSVHDGVRGGGRAPSERPDDDRDGRIDEDPLDGIDDDHDGSIDEDFAAIGDEMTAALFAPRDDAGLVVRQEVYAWSLTHLDASVVMAVTVRNTASEARVGVRVGFKIKTEERMTTERSPRIESSRWNAGTERAGQLGLQTLVLRGRDGGLGLVLMAPRGEGDSAWEVGEDGETLQLTSSSLGALTPGGELTVYVGLVLLPSDDLRVARSLHATARTIFGDGSTRLVPPPVPVTPIEPAGASTTAQPAGGPDSFWNTPGRLLEALLVGSPNPFRDSIAIDYQVPERVVDEHGVEHVLSGAAMTSVKVYNVAGRLVATLVDTEHAPGRYRTGWTAQNDIGESVASGVYYVKLTIGKRSVTQRMVQLK